MTPVATDVHKRLSVGDDGFYRFQWRYGGPSIGVRFDIHDLWVGVYWKRDLLTNRLVDFDVIHGIKEPRDLGYFWMVYICLLPCLPIRIVWIRDVTV